jgi:DNA-binding NtrC family response regulator
MKKLKILVVEDDPVTRTILEKKLSREGYEVEVAINGVEAMESVSRSYYDVVITDMMMPGGVDGMEVMEYTRAKHERTEIIMMTAYATVDHAVEAMKKGAADYLEKPINFHELILRLEKISTLNSLAKDARDLREAMDVTERNAAQTIQVLEVMVSELNHKLVTIKETLSQDNVQHQECINQALQILS